MAKVLDRPTTSAEQARRATLLRYYRDVCDLLPNARVEIINGRIVVSDVPTGEHNDIISRLILQIVALVATRDWSLWTNIKLFLGPQVDRYIPDLAIVPPDRRMWGEDEVYGDSTLLVVEAVSRSSINDDHLVKPKNCAIAGVPLYLVIDPLEGRVRLLSHPSEAGYTREVTVKFGDSLELPEPWDLTIDTGKLIEA
ncbi:Uma2 family endonuclease [Sphaerimonospora cavernae]|uniref:Uma2 family endonuclease n=1 Tax=Sphaerimonospora cavernae TaxID=1740611 RepID=A0ABV6U262_9ACTN